MTGRVKVYEARDIAKSIRETFTAKKAREEIRFPFHWPQRMQHVGDSESIGYSSDKWKHAGQFELYKHLAESPNKVLVKNGFLRDREDPQKPWPTIGPVIDFSDVPMPKEFACLAFFEEINLRLFVAGTDERPRFGKRPDDGVVQVEVGHAYVGASKIMWSVDRPTAKDQPFLFVYTEKEGPLMMVVGKELDVEADGIVG